MNWLGLLFGNLWRRPARSAFTLIGVALAVGSFLTLAGLSRGMTAAAEDSLNERSVDLVVVKRGMVEFFASVLPETLEAEIAAVPGVAEVSAELATLTPLSDDAHAIVAGWRAESFEWREIQLLRGRMPGPGERGVVLGEGLAEALAAAPGTEVKLSFTPFRVTGIAGFTSVLNRGLAVMRLEELQQLLARPDQVTLFNIRLARPGDDAAVAAARIAIAGLRPDLAVTTTDEVLRGNKAIQVLVATAGAISVVALAIAALSVLNTLAIAVEERTRDIGILAAIGWSRGRILGLVLSEGLLLSGLGGLLGAGLGTVGNQLLSLTVVPGGGVSARGTFGLTMAALAASLVLGAAGALWPAWRAARLDPAVALRR
jgi:putative ABC transport system permease protein